MTVGVQIQRTVVVTGGSRGIGRAVCEAFAEPGTLVCFNYAANAEAAALTEKAIVSAGADALSYKADVSNETEMTAFFKAILDRSGRIDVLVNNAGITRDGLLARMKTEDWDRVIATNLNGVFHCTKQATKPMMKQRYGRIINITSVIGVMGNPGQSNYAASKAGIIGFTKSVARELASRNITANAVAPGYIDTEMTDALPEKAREALVQQIPLGRTGTANEVAKVVVFLASEGAAYITGQVLHVNGGLYT
jgi:3-oxoacyl-[acyl-carrier protein] reductase